MPLNSGQRLMQKVVQTEKLGDGAIHCRTWKHATRPSNPWAGFDSNKTSGSSQEVCQSGARMTPSNHWYSAESRVKSLQRLNPPPPRTELKNMQHPRPMQPNLQKAVRRLRSNHGLRSRRRSENIASKSMLSATSVHRIATWLRAPVPKLGSQHSPRRLPLGRRCVGILQYQPAPHATTTAAMRNGFDNLAASTAPSPLVSLPPQRQADSSERKRKRAKPVLRKRKQTKQLAFRLGIAAHRSGCQLAFSDWLNTHRRTVCCPGLSSTNKSNAIVGLAVTITNAREDGSHQIAIRFFVGTTDVFVHSPK